MNDPLKQVTEATVVRVQPGDVIWLKVNSAARITPDLAKDIRNRAKEIWPDNEIAVSDNIDVSLVRTRDTNQEDTPA